MTRIATSAVVAVVALLVGGCSSGSSGPSTGTLTGLTRVYGGAAGDTGDASVGEPGGGIIVSVISAARVTTTATSDPTGHFTFTLKPGAYVLTGCGNPLPVTITAGQSTTHDLSCPVS